MPSFIKAVGVCRLTQLVMAKGSLVLRALPDFKRCMRKARGPGVRNHLKNVTMMQLNVVKRSFETLAVLSYSLTSGVYFMPLWSIK